MSNTTTRLSVRTSMQPCGPPYAVGSCKTCMVLFFLVSFETKTWEFLLPGKT
ncbi:hypothetical protein CMEL01_00605 [Colletotrichum melonis]|uniref:Uncharacterized protein n=1 Tax=Colletotrichum melonis TaxID=1209925 RepID=A0AAI9Y2B6_9PEZI|nr:hypothetical protein CMEL01_00605 [Colletotrichum melonis]